MNEIDNKEHWTRLRRVLRETTEQMDEDEDQPLSYLLRAALQRLDMKMQPDLTAR